MNKKDSESLSTHACDSFNQQIKSLTRQGYMPDLLNAMQKVTDTLRAAVKFRVQADTAKLVNTDVYGMVPQFHLPFDICAFEIPDETPLESRAPDCRHGENLIILCWSHGANPFITKDNAEISEIYPNGGAWVMALETGAESPIWTTEFGMTFIPYGLPPEGAADGAFIELIDNNIARALSEEPPLSEQERQRNIILQNAMAVTILIPVCTSLNRGAVEQTDVKLSKLKNRMRRDKNKTPLFEFHILTIDTTQLPAPQEPSQGGTHASPRMHLRRGHTRTLKSGRVLWIHDTVVGSENNGVIAKEYATIH